MGPFFALGTDASAGGWQPAAGLYRSGPDGLLALTGGQLAAADPRVAASIAQLDYAARLWSPVLGCGLLESVVPDLASLQVSTARPVRLALAQPRGWLASDYSQVADLSYHVVVEGHLEPLANALSDRLATGLMWGNAASAMAGTLGVLVTARPDLRPAAVAVATALLGTGRLRDTGQLGVTGGGLGFRRRSCCLYYRLPGGGLCGDCCLSRLPKPPA